MAFPKMEKSSIYFYLYDTYSILHYRYIILIYRIIFWLHMVLYCIAQAYLNNLGIHSY